jgi:hypothetical protein
MKRLSVFMVVSTLIVGTAGCQQCNWFKRPSGAVCSSPAATYVVPSAMAPVTSPAACGQGCNSCSSNSLPILSGTQGYAAAPTN